MDSVLMENKVLNLDKSSWVLTKLGDLAKDISKRVDNPGESKYDRFVGLGNFVSGDIKIKTWETTENLASSAKAFQAGDILFARRNAYLRRASLVDFDGCCSGDAFVLRENHDKVVPGFIAFLLNSNSLWDYANSNAAGTMSKRVKWRDLAQYEFLLPPKDQQAQLAKLLWAMDEVIEAIVKHSEQMSLSKHHVLENKIIQFSENARLSTLGEIGKWISGGTPSKKVKEYWENGNVLWVTPKDMKSDRIDSTFDMVTEHAVNNGRSKLFRGGSTVLVWRSGILQHTLPIVQVEPDFTVNQDLKVFQPSCENFSEEYVRIYLSTYAEKIRRACVKEGTTVQSIDTDSFLRFNIPALNEVDQNELIREDSAFKEAIDQSKEALKNSRSLQKSLINQVF